MGWRQVTDWVGRADIAGDCKRLAAAAAEIDVAPRTASARFLHPGCATEGVEGRGVSPDVIE